MIHRMIIVDGVSYRCAVATTWAERRRGLAGTPRTRWGDIDGLLIPFPCRGWWPIWTRGMRFSIDLLWLCDDRVVDVHGGVHPHPWRLYWPCAVSTAVFERLPNFAAKGILKMSATRACAHRP